MIETNNPSLNVNEIMTKIKEEVAKRNHISYNTIQQKDLQLNLTTEKDFEQKDQYKIIDFTKYHDITFITNVYKGVLKRNTDAQGMQIYLDLLRSGSLSKSEILTDIRFSKEGRSKNVRIEGIKKRFFIYSLYHIPILGYATKSMITLLSLPKLIHRINRNESMLALQNEIINNYIHNSRIKDNITEEEKHKFDMFFVELENKFRGSREDIKKRVEVYLPYIDKLPYTREEIQILDLDTREEIQILDLGCGRGEWLELLSEKGYSSRGIDLNSVMVKKSQELGLDVQEFDVIEYLESLEDNSLSVITGFHIIEHLPFQVLMKMYEESLRVLKPGGMVIFETPNPENILVGAHYFYRDPSHTNPHVPATTQFVLEQIGFCKIEIKRLHKYSEFYSIDTDIDLLKDNMCNEMDFAVIGYKL